MGIRVVELVGVVPAPLAAGGSASARSPVFPGASRRTHGSPTHHQPVLAPTRRDDLREKRNQA